MVKAETVLPGRRPPSSGEIEAAFRIQQLSLCVSVYGVRDIAELLRRPVGRPSQNCEYAMLFDTPVFFVFLVLVVSAYWLLKGRQQNALLLVASYFFYGWWDWGVLFR